MEPKAFLSISTELSNLVNNSSSGFSEHFINSEHYPEIIYRTMANRSYYYLYHELKPILANLIKNDNDLNEELKKIGIKSEKIDEIFQHHAKIAEFFEELSKQLENELKKRPLKKEVPKIQELKNTASYIAMIIRSYKTIREFADYQIDIPIKEIEMPIDPNSKEKIKIEINFQTPSQAASDYITDDIKDARDDIAMSMRQIFNDLPKIKTSFYYVHIIRDIIEMLSKRKS